MILKQRLNACVAATVMCLAIGTGSPGAMAAGITVGSSSLIGVLDYSDTFTLGVGDRENLAPNQFPVGSPGTNVENNYGNPPMVWSDGFWSISNDANFIPGSLPYPGTSGAGSDTGMTQTGGAVDYGLEYGLRSQYVVQFDAVQTVDRINITSGASRNAIGAGGPGVGLSFFFRADDGPSATKIGVFNGSGEVDTGLGPIGVNVGEWANYAVFFDQDNSFVEFFVNEISVGSLDLTTFAAGLYANWSNAAVSVGGAGGDRVWTDNFQVGALIPEPGSMTLLLLGLLSLGRLRRRLG